MNWEFLVFGSGIEVRRYPIRQGFGYLGRYHFAEYRLDYPGVPRFALGVQADGDQVTLTGLNTRGEVFINNIHFHNGSYVLCRGDFIRISDFLFIFQQANPGENDVPAFPTWNDLESNPEYRALRETILAHPADDAPRLVISDWLEEHDFPDIAGFIRMQLAEPAKIAGMAIEVLSTATLAVCRLLLEKWFLLLGHHAWRWRFRRGFICEIELPCETFMAHARELFTSLPIEKVRLTDRMPNVSLQYYHQTGEIYSWMESSISRPVEEMPGAAIPEEIFRRLRTQGTAANDYSSAVEAIEALSAACVAHGRSLAGVG